MWAGGKSSSARLREEGYSVSSETWPVVSSRAVSRTKRAIRRCSRCRSERSIGWIMSKIQRNRWMHGSSKGVATALSKTALHQKQNETGSEQRYGGENAEPSSVQCLASAISLRRCQKHGMRPLRVVEKCATLRHAVRPRISIADLRGCPQRPRNLMNVQNLTAPTLTSVQIGF